LSLKHTIELEKEKSRLYLEIAPVLCLGLDAEGYIALLNPKGCEILGITKEEAIGKNWFDTFVCPQQVVEAKKLFQGVVAGTHPMVEYYENLVYSKNGEERMIAWHNVMLRDVDGKITGSFSSGEDITKIKKSEQELERITHYDALTNLPNRLLLTARLEHSIQRAQRENTKIVVLYVDIDNFKDINETYGYSVGDLIIKQAALKMRDAIRNEDTISRVGGDEFIILTENFAKLKMV
jgi:PAS domain S-box-containing protein